MSTGSPTWNQPWFLGAPATKLSAILSLALYVAVSSHSQWSHDTFTLDTAKLLTQQQPLYHLLSYPIIFESTGELVLGTIVLVQFGRRFEREMGSRKYCLWMLSTYLISTFFLLVVGAMVRDLSVCGPYPLMGGLLYLYHVYAPRMHPRFFGVFGMHVSEKSIPYLFALQVLLYRRWDSVLPAGCGMIAAFLALKLNLDVPDSVAELFGAWGQRFSGEVPPNILAQRASTTRAAAPRAAAAAPAAFQRPPPPPQSAIDQLTSMGFEREAVLRALEASFNNVEQAANRLITGGS